MDTNHLHGSLQKETVSRRKPVAVTSLQGHHSDSEGNRMHLSDFGEIATDSWISRA